MTDEAMPLIFRDEGLDLGEFPHLMADRVGIGSAKRGPAPATGGWHAGDEGRAGFDGNEGPLVLGVAGLATARTLGLGLGPQRLGVWVFRGGGLGGVGGVFADSVFEFHDTCVETFDLSGLPVDERDDARWEGAPDIRWKGWRSVHSDPKATR
jgi:hypothetical protein